MDQATAQENWLTPSFTPDTRILILEADKASWIQIEEAENGATAIQFLPSGCLDDVCGAQLATIEKVWMLERGGNEVDIVQFGEAYITANHPILTSDGWMMASQAAAKGHGTALSDNVYSKLYSLQLVTGGNIIINTSTSTDLPPTHTETATMGYRFLPPSNPLNINFPTPSQQKTGPRDGLAAQAKPSYSQVTQLRLRELWSRPNPQPTPPGSETNALPELEVQPIEDTTNATRHATLLATCLHLHSDIVPDPQLKGIGIPETYQDILIQTPTGERVPEHEIQWEPNPQSRVCGDTSQLLEIVPGHHHFKANYLATYLCSLVDSDPRSQFYKTPPTRESGLTSGPLWSLGKGKTIKRQKFFASRRQAWAIGDKEKTATTSPIVQVSAPSLNQNQGLPDTNADSLGGQGRPDTNADRAGAQELTRKETDVTPHDNNLFYKNGNPKTSPNARPLPRGPTSKTRKRQGGRKRNRRRNRRGRPSDEASKELNLTTTERHRR